MNDDEYFHSRHFVPDVAALPGEPVVERDAPESRQQRRLRERQDAKAQPQRGNGIYEPAAPQSMADRLQPPDAPPIEVNPHDEPDAERSAQEKATGGSHPTGPPPNGAHYGKRGVDLADIKRKPERAQEKQPTVELVSAAAIEPEPVDWLWDGWFAKGKLQVIAGIPGTGKTTLALALGAITSIGGVWPDGSLSWRAPMREPEEEKVPIGLPLPDMTMDQFMDIEDSEDRIDKKRRV